MRAIVPLSVFIILSMTAHGYEIESHKELTQIVLERGSVGSGVVFDKVGIPSIGFDNRFEKLFDQYNSINVFPNSKGKDKTIYELLQDGVDFEDTVDKIGPLEDPDLGRWRVVNHFYDPQNGGRALTQDGYSPGESSPKWILEDEGEAFGVTSGIPSVTVLTKITPQLFSYKEGRDYFHEALTEPTKTKRDSNFGLMFQSLGHLVHHIQDMGQPQHVRNDDHLPYIDNDFVEKYVEKNYSKEGGEVGGVQTSSLESIVDASPQYTGVSIMLPRARDYWDWESDTGDQGLHRIGMAEYASTNFVTDDTNFRWEGASFEPDPEYPQPEVETVPTQFEEFATAVAGCRATGFTSNGVDPITGKLAWFITNVIDNYLDPNDPNSGHRQTNPQASAYSVWSEELLTIPDFTDDDGAGFTVNECVIDKRLDFVIPRIIAFSTGMIDYFFRGKMEISSPEEGVYAFKDHKVGAGQSITLDSDGKTQVNGSRFGYDKIRLKLRNTTPNIDLPDHPPFSAGPVSISQDMFDGSLQAIVKYSLNHCYQENGSGGFGPGALENADSSALNDDLTSLSTRSTSGCSGSNYFSNGSVTDSDELTLDIRRRSFEHISKSLTKTIGPGAGDDFVRIEKNTPMLIDFDFSSDPIPLNAIDVRLQVVYRGKLGPEDESELPVGAPTMVEQDAVVVTTKDISEPSDVVIANLTDHILNLPIRRWVTLEPAADADGNRPDLFNLTIDPTYLNPGNYKYYFYADRPGSVPPPILQVDLTVPSRYEIRKDDGITPLSTDQTVSGEHDLELFPQDADSDLVTFTLDDGTNLPNGNSYQLRVDTTKLDEGKHTITATLRYLGKLISFDTEFIVHNNTSNTAPDLAEIADVNQVVTVNTFQAIDIPLAITESQTTIQIEDITLTSDIEGLIDPNRFMEVRPDQSGGFLLHLFDNVEYSQQPGALPLFYEYSHIKVNVTVSDGELEDTESFVFRRVMQGYTSQGYFQPEEIVIATDRVQTIPITLADIVGPGAVSGASYDVGNDMDLAVYHDVVAELGIDQSGNEGVRTVDQINTQLYAEWSLAGGEYDNLMPTDLLKKMIDEQGWVNSMPIGVEPGHEFITSYDNLSFTFKDSDATSNLLEIDELDIDQFTRFSFLSDLNNTFTLTGGVLGYFSSCSSVKPEIHQWDESIGAYIQKGSVRKVGNVFTANRDLNSMFCQIQLPSLGNLGLVNQADWTANIETVLDSKSLTQKPLDLIDSDY